MTRSQAFLSPKSTTARGYGWGHQKLRKRLAMLVSAGGVNCWRCGQPIRPGSVWHLGHHDWDHSRYMGPEHRRCNLRAAGLKAGVLKNWSRRSQEW
jgi:hypothetical protein